jgi:hypothetical protein
VRGRDVVQNLSSSMSEISLEQLSLGCGRDFRPLHRSLAQMVGVMDALEQASNRALNLLACERIVPIYTDIVYDGTCRYSISGFTWIFCGLFIVSVMGMIMIMFRSSFQNTVFERPQADTSDESSAVNPRRGTTSPSSKKEVKENDVDHWDDEDAPLNS